VCVFTTPVDDTEAINELLVDQTPPEVVLLNAIVDPVHVLGVPPVITAGIGLTVTVAVADTPPHGLDCR
jgi:hypothetical protein